MRRKALVEWKFETKYFRNEKSERREQNSHTVLLHKVSRIVGVRNLESSAYVLGLIRAIST